MEKIIGHRPRLRRRRARTRSIAERQTRRAVALASSLIAGYFPARKAARVYPVDIIRGAT